ncbi:MULTISPECIES: SulP family inorganic anion transporter [Sporosarcina]|uniref:Sulfate permease, SulP family n=2 Tax=Sporosarcina newyorkensis TaxID=759851 RepID=A0A1T4Z0H8_9BACL|nr:MULTISPECIES: SulP family inorganic anion transporter [Sporosarcina]EGQ25745.1 sulfate permease [Sporosarcina newyorkensis 2681]MBY0224049.1 SulP family inorganic anion transporter [Sporosarcina aquimarina]SKB07025.1 sulfate permease, SulP family [Sporosarcina newyorkensis]
MHTFKQQWLGNVRADLLAGIVVGLALIPEALAFAFIVGVDPRVALYASFTIAVITSFVGGRPGLISAATGAMALVLVSLMANHGLQYVLAATILTGIIQLILGSLGVANLMRFIPNSVMLGFVNALGIMIFITQMPYLLGSSMMTYIFAVVTLILVYAVPRFFTAIPAPLIAIVVMTTVALLSGVKLQTIGDLGTMPSSLPMFFLPDIPLNLETLKIILPYSLALSVVGLLESLLTSQVLDDMTATPSNKNREARGQGIANFITGFFGGMAGCALIGQSVINIKSGGRGRLSTLTAGVFLIFLIIVLGDVVVKIPMPVLAGVMIMVSMTTFNWGSFKFLRQAPKSESIVMLITVAIILYTHNLAIGVVIGVILSALFFVAKISRVTVTKNAGVYRIKGPLFFASTTKFIQSFDDTAEKEIIIDFGDSQLWDESAVGAIFKVKQKLEAKGTDVTIRGLNASSEILYKKLL